MTTGASLTAVTVIVLVAGVLFAAPSLAVQRDRAGGADGLSLVVDVGDRVAAPPGSWPPRRCRSGSARRWPR